MWIKICGIQDVKHAVAAATAGADAIGLVFAPSKRQLDLPAASAISRALPASVQRVGVFVNAAADLVHHYYRACELDWVQLHGQEDLAYCQALNLPLIKAINLRQAADLALVERFRVYPVLLDAPEAGSGKTADWQLAADAARLHPRLILAGGLTAANVGGALTRVLPYGVDVSSGVESAGHKDAAKIAAFVQAARQQVASSVS